MCRRIQEGEEIVASYLAFAELPLRQTRRDMLRPWGFECRLGPKVSGSVSAVIDSFRLEIALIVLASNTEQRSVFSPAKV